MSELPRLLGMKATALEWTALCSSIAAGTEPLPRTPNPKPQTRNPKTLNPSVRGFFGLGTLETCWLLAVQDVSFRGSLVIACPVFLLFRVRFYGGAVREKGDAEF